MAAGDCRANPGNHEQQSAVNDAAPAARPMQRRHQKQHHQRNEREAL
jgi:hypothetical protein